MLLSLLCFRRSNRTFFIYCFSNFMSDSITSSIFGSCGFDIASPKFSSNRENSIFAEFLFFIKGQSIPACRAVFHPSIYNFEPLTRPIQVHQTPKSRISVASLRDKNVTNIKSTPKRGAFYIFFAFNPVAASNLFKITVQYTGSISII